jgi:hypothetical protein
MVTEAGVIQNWDDLSGLVREHFKRGWIFRGVKKSSYRLIPSIGREDARKHSHGDLLPYQDEEEKGQLRQFIREGRGRFQWQPQNDLEWMILGQHHRLPTRLLDWSESLLVAAYFAVEEVLCEAAIYGIKPPPEIMDLNMDPFGKELGDTPRLIRPPHINPRITAQRGVLTLHPKPDQAWDVNEIHRWTIPATATFTLKGMLAFCGLHAASLFPDSADRDTEYIGWLYKWGRLSG